ncbi:MAG: DNA-processing protein DprA [Clostridia bacterium]|nr:DNA-processing protein DprA [Clostridia bacterium]
MNDLIYWIWLSLSVTPDTRTFKRLISNFADAKEIYEADLSEISRHIGFRSSDRTALADKDLTRAAEIMEFCQKNDVGILTYPDERFPESLREIPSPPVLLYYRGTFPDFNKHFSVAMVGTRSISDYGRSMAFNVAYDLASAGAIIVSGMAMGIDGISHAGALAADGVTVAVIGTGINVCYPEGHLKLAREIVKHGCVITEFPPGTRPSKITFPKRNRIISGLSAATLVVEGKERSGSLITARHAIEQRRVVYALPGSVNEKNSQATNLLIKNGAMLFTCADDIIRDFKDVYPGVINPFKLPEKCPVNVMDALRRYGVVAVAPNDDVFHSPYSKRSNKAISDNKSTPREAEQSETINAAKAPTEDSFDKDALAVYKKIPPSGDCAIESLVDEDTDLRKVMRSLLKLEMGSFIEMLPGERVMRKL